MCYYFNLGSSWNLISPSSITPESKHEGLENKGSDHQQEKLLIVKKILLDSALEM